jgi:hypothetical protein
MKTRTTRLQKLLITGMLLGAGALDAQAASNVWLEVRVLDRNTGDAIENAAVCLGTTARPDQFGARRSDENGAVRFDDLLSNALLVTASKEGFKGEQQMLESLHQSRMLVMKIVSGGGGPRCDAPLRDAAESPNEGLSIENISVREDPDSTERMLVSVRVNGQANQIRISENADFRGASWQSYQNPLAVPVNDRKGAKTIYVQVRRYVEAKGASMEVVSPVKTGRYRVY